MRRPATAPMAESEHARTQLARRYGAVRMWVALAALIVAPASSPISGSDVGYRVTVAVAALVIHSCYFRRRSGRGVAGALAVDVTVVGVISLVLGLPVAAGMGTAFIAVTINILARGAARGWLLAYAGAWLLGVLAVVLPGGGPAYTEAQVHLVTTLTIVFFLTSIAAMVAVVMGELERRDAARGEAEQALRASEERYRTLVQEAFDAVVVVDAEGTLRYASSSFERVTGLSPHEPLQELLADRIHPADADAWVEAVRRAHASPGEPVRARLRVGRPEGGWRTLETVVTNLQGNPAVAGLVCNLRDATEQVQAEAALRESEHRFRTAFQDAPIGMALLGFDGSFLQVNPAACTLLGYPEEALCSMKWRHIEGGDSTGGGPKGDLPGDGSAAVQQRRLVRSDGLGRDCTVSLSTVRDASGRPHHLIVQLVDITDLKQAQRQLEQALRSKDEFVAAVSHELRTPLTAVVGFGELLREPASGLSARERREMVETVSAQAAEMSRIVEDLLVAARSDAGEMRVVSVPVDLRAQAAQVLEGWRAGQVAHVVLDPGTQRALGDPARVRQIVRNLVLNALRYGGEHVRVRARRVGDGACLLVVDDGPGIPEEARARVFEPYQQAHRVPGVTASIGMGLTVSRRLARLMGGDLTYRYEDGKSVFTLTLPRLAEAQQPSAGLGEPQALGARSPAGSGARLPV